MNLKKIKDTLLPDIIQAIPVKHLSMHRVSTPHKIRTENPGKHFVTYVVSNGHRKAVIAYARGETSGRYYLNGKSATVAAINAYLIKIFRINK